MASPKNEGFLTDQQREVLKIAVQNAEVLSSSPSPRSPTSSLLLQEFHKNAVAAGGGGGGGKPAGAKHVRRTHSGKSVKVKKDGGGGKGTWGKLIDTDPNSDSCLDRNDPNYDSGEEPYELVGSTILDPFDDYKKSVVTLISEYFSTGSVETAMSDLTELGFPEYHNYFIKRLVSTAMDKKDREKEMASVLLSSLYSKLFTSVQISQGFMMLLEAIDDLALDIPDASDVLAVFISRAVVDEILPPAFIARMKENLPEGSRGIEVLEIAEKSYLSAPHHAELLERRWGGSTRLSVEEAKKKIVDLLKEYVQNGDMSEACRCIRELGVPFFHHEVVKRALILAMEKPGSEIPVLELLKEANNEGLISSSQMSKGFSRVGEILDDLSLDIPSCKTLFDALVRKAASNKWLDSSFSHLSSNTNGDVKKNGDFDKLKRYKEEVVSIIHEYFSSDDIQETIRSLQELNCPENNPIFIKKLITLAMDRKNREREMASVLLSSLSFELFSTDDVANGFTLLLESAEDTALDVLDASDELALFLARAVIDDVLAPLNLEEISNKLPSKCSGNETITMARTLSSVSHAGERLLRCWGGGSGWAVEDAKDKIQKLLEEYVTGGDLSEACRCIRDLNMPFFNHEVVKKGIVLGMEGKCDDKVMELLSECFGEGLITINQLSKGFVRVRDGLDDLALDIPDAKEKFRVYVDKARESGWLLASFV